jgi:cytochrome c oxidase cbb3-type subunit IV
MDSITTLRVIATVLSFLCFVGILIWVSDRRKNQRFDEASQLPFLDE